MPWQQIFTRAMAALGPIREFGVMNFIALVVTLTVVYGFGSLLNRGVSADSFNLHHEETSKLLGVIRQELAEANRDAEAADRREALFMLEDCIQRAEIADMSQARCWDRHDGIPPPRPKNLKR